MNPLGLFLLQILAILSVARLVGWPLRRIGQPMVIAEILAGILLGPSFLGWLFPELSQGLFPAVSLNALQLVSQLGLLLYMFLVGIELDPAFLRGKKGAAVAISLGSILLPFGLGMGLAVWLHGRWSSTQAPLLPFMLFLGVSMSITAFPVLVRMLSERNLMQTRLGALAVPVAAVDDIAAWCMLALAIGVFKAQGWMAGAATAGWVLVYLAVMWFLIRPFLRRLLAFKRESGRVSQEMVALFMALLLASAWLTEAIGIHALFGAFFLGAILPKKDKLADALAGKIEDLVVVLFLPLFFAFSGLRTQLALLNTVEAWWACGAILSLAVLGKFLGGLLPARLSGLSWREAATLGVLLNTRGLVELVVLNIGLDLGLISPTVFTMMVLMALATTFMATPLSKWFYPEGGVALEAVGKAPAAALPSSGGFGVAMCVSYASSGPGLFRVAQALTRQDGGSRLLALCLPPPPARKADLEQTEEEAPAMGMEVLSPLLALARQAGREVSPVAFVSARPAQDIARIAARDEVDLVLMGWHKPLIGQALLGGVVYEVMRRDPADVAVLVDRGLEEIRRVLIPFQGSIHDRMALTLVRRMMKNQKTAATLLHVVAPEENADRFSQANQTVSQVFAESGQVVEMKVVAHAHPVEAALAEAGLGYDLVVIGVGEKWGLRERAVGLQPDTLMRDCPVSLLVVRQGGASRQG